MKRLIVLLMVVLATACDGDGDGTTGATETTGPATTGARTGTTGAALIPVPDVVGLSVGQARSDLRTAGLRPWRHRFIYTEEPAGTVLKQQIDPGTEVRLGRRIQFTIAKRIPRPLFGNPWGYSFQCCRFIRDPPSGFCSYFKCIPDFSSGVGWVVQCGDRAFSQSGAEWGAEYPQGSCSDHGGENRPLLQLQGRLVDPALDAAYDD